MKELKRFTRSPAYVDGFNVSVHVIIGLLFSLAFSTMLHTVVSPVWLGIAITSVFFYQLAIFWLMRQFTDVTRVFVTLIFGFISLGLITSLVAYVTQVRLPNDLPIVTYLYGFYPFHTSSYDPGSVAIYYASFAQIVSLAATIPSWLLGGAKPVNRSVDIPLLKRLDLYVDVYLDRVSIYLDSHAYSWALVLAGAIAIVVTIVVGSAALLL